MPPPGHGIVELLIGPRSDAGVAIRRDGEFLLKRLAQARIPADRRRPVAGRELCSHQFAMGGLIGGRFLGQPFPLMASPQQLDETRMQPFACRFRPSFVGRAGKQIAAVGADRLCARLALAAGWHRQRRHCELLETVGIDGNAAVCP